ncbi:ChbG/HpnK family deacetylase [Pseudactinotalea sp. Z1732]|uniref:ChbG/HpnK family deacetylase n=1 Tax=Micrococcales TaxID=85006 RepID=UPI003C79A569
MTARSVTITADDFGLNPAVNAAIIELSVSGRLHAASVLVEAPHAAAALEAQVPIAVGLHVALAPAMLAGATGEQIHAEIERQWDRMVRHGRTPAHLDLHTAALYGVGAEALRPGGVLVEALAVAAAHRVPLRLPRVLPPGFADGTEGHAALLAAADEAGVALPEAICTDFRPGQEVSGYGDLRAHYRALIAQLPAGRSEVFLHPAVPSGTESDDDGTRPGSRAGDDGARPGSRAPDLGTRPGGRAHHSGSHPGGRTPVGTSRSGEHGRDGATHLGSDAADSRKCVWEYQLLVSGDLHHDLAAANIRT